MPMNGRQRCRRYCWSQKHDGPTMFARIGVTQAINRHVERVFNPSRKDKHWGCRKLARDR